MGRILLIHHAARREESDPPNSLSGLRRCLDAGARVVEVDISPLADGDFALLHEGRLDEATNGDGIVAEATARYVGQLHLRWGDTAGDEPIGLLSGAVALVSANPRLEELQLDLKLHAPLTDPILDHLVRLVKPVEQRVRITTAADWAVRRLWALDAELPRGFDPMLYLDVESRRSSSEGGSGDEDEPPFRSGAYGYRDDHPLASRRWGSASAYLAARAEALWAQAPTATVWYVRASLLARVLDDGFDWITFLHKQGAQVAAWTLDPDQPHHLALARQLISAGVDRITTNNAPRLAALLGGDVVF
jgi:glycerophosphoryl diester phosphodiesterase